MAGTAVGSLARFASIAILTRYYSKEEFGLWVAITSFTAITITGDFGISNSIRNKLSYLASLGKKGNEQAHHYYLSAFYFFLFLGVLFSALLIFFHDNIPLHLLFKTSNTYILQSGIEIILISQIIIFLSIPLGISLTSFFSYQEIPLLSIINIFQALVNLLMILFLAYFGASIVTIAIIYFIICFITGVIGTFLFLIRRRWKFEYITVREIIRHNIELAPLGMKFFLVQISNSILLNSMTLIIGASISLSDAGEFNIVQKIYMFFMSLFLSISNPLWVAYSDAANRGAWGWCKKTLKSSLVITFFVFCLLIVIMLIFGNSILQIISNKQYSVSPLIFFLMGIWTLINAIGNCSSQLQNSLGKLNLIIIVNLLAALLVVPVISYTGTIMGLIGITIGGIIVILPGASITTIQAYLIIKKRQHAK
jgi:O-antigen/teichoic acid export membrane protein